MDYQLLNLTHFLLLQFTERFSGFGKPHNCRKESILCGVDKDFNEIKKIHIDELKTGFHRLVTSVENRSKCSQVARFGNEADGGYDVCMTPPYRPQPGNCLVYSFGIRNDWSFDEEMANYSCEVHSFDPSIGLADHLHSPNVHFHNIGLWGESFVNEKKWNLQTLSDIRHRLGHAERPISVLKVDVEGAEWPFLRDVTVHDPTQLSDVGQLLLELHTPRFRRTTLTKVDLFEMIYYFDRLLDSGSNGTGFTVHLNRQRNWCCARFAPLMPPGVAEKCCHEVYLLNTRFAGKV